MALAAPALGGPEIGFLYVEGNVGGASGGHAGLRFGDVVFHRQRSPDGVFWIVREPWASFRFQYGTLQNRPMHVAYLPMAPASYEAARDRFTRDRIDQRRRVEALGDARRDRLLLEDLAAGRRLTRVRGTGLLDPQRAGDPDAEALRGRLAEALGPDFLAEAVAETERAVQAVPGIAADEATRLRLLLERRGALEALAEAQGLDAKELVHTDALLELPPLTPPQREALDAWSAQLETAILALLRSPRPDNGHPILLAAARRQAIARSLDEGRLVLLDPYPDDARTLEGGAVRRRHDELAALAGHAARGYREARAALLSGPIDEAGWNRLEARAARTREAWRGAHDGAPTRKVDGRLLPERSRLRPVDLPRPGPDAVHRAREREEARASELASHYGYDLLRRNCVTELLRTLDAAFPDPELRAAALGGELEPGAGLGFIPFVWFDQVVASLGVGRVERIPPYRERALEGLVSDARRPVVVAARERNTVTGTLYERRDRDGSFLFFTDDLRFSRPLFGLGNVTYGIGDGLVGLLAAPFDRGRRLRRAGRGIFFSLPELAFFNVRKGSFDAASLPPAPALAARPGAGPKPEPGLGAVGEVVELPAGRLGRGL
jgi:hypothetical protein